MDNSWPIVLKAAVEAAVWVGGAFLALYLLGKFLQLALPTIKAIMEEPAASGPRVSISAEGVPAVESYEEAYKIVEGQLEGNGIDLIANLLTEYRQDCPDGMFEGEYASRRFRRWLSEKIAKLLLP